MQWQSFPTAYSYNGLRLGLKSDSFIDFLEMPSVAGDVFHLAVRATAPVRATLRSKGWGLADIDKIGVDPWAYHSFIQHSKAEFGIAKAGYVTTQAGWFSERSAGYLASGRPVLHQETGFTEWLPSGKGVLSFSCPDDAADAIAEVDRNYDLHRCAAREIAEAYFDSRRVLQQLIDAAV
jgi:hypothetical protein